MRSVAAGIDGAAAVLPLSCVSQPPFVASPASPHPDPNTMEASQRSLVTTTRTLQVM
jgi:hypothetical protein